MDEGQFEAGRSLGLNYRQTMQFIIMPQAFKNVLPAADKICRLHMPGFIMAGADNGYQKSDRNSHQNREQRNNHGIDKAFCYVLISVFFYKIQRKFIDKVLHNGISSYFARTMITCLVVAFGLNSGAYVAEIVRSGIMSVDEGQFEAGRSLGR